MYSWAGQLYTNLTAVYQRIKEISAGLTGFSGEKMRIYFCPRIIGKIFFCPRIALMDTNGCNGLNGDRVGRTNLHECNKFFIYMSCGVLPSRQNQCNRFLPRTSSPVTIATLCTAFQADCPQRNLLSTNCTNFRASECKTELGFIL